MSNILVVGGAGYIGSHVVAKLLENGYQIIVLDDLSTGSLEAVLGGHFYHGCMSEKKLLRKIFSKHDISSVMLFASNVNVGESITNPMRYYLNNVSKSLVLINEMIKHNVLKIIYSSTASICSTDSHIRTANNETENPRNPYARTKLIVENMLTDFDKAYGLKNVILRYYNAAGADPLGRIGFSKSSLHLIPQLLKVASGRKKSFDLNGNDYQTYDGTCVRDFIHVMDIASAHLKALKYINTSNKSTNENLGLGKGYSVLEVINMVKKVTKKEINIKKQPKREGDPAYIVMEASNENSNIAFDQHEFSLEQIVEHSWKWELGFNKYPQNK